MNITVNGKEHQLSPPATVKTLLASIDLANKPVIVELNQKALFPREYPETMLGDGDKIEIITIAAGG